MALILRVFAIALWTPHLHLHAEMHKRLELLTNVSLVWVIGPTGWEIPMMGISLEITLASGWDVGRRFDVASLPKRIGHFRSAAGQFTFDPNFASECLPKRNRLKNSVTVTLITGRLQNDFIILIAIVRHLLPRNRHG